LVGLEVCAQSREPVEEAMIFKRFFDPKLAQASYLLGCPSSKEALIIDPNRSIDQYLRGAAEENLRIAHVTETHIHADFVSGARELAQRTGARLYLSGAGGRDWQYEYGKGAGATLLQDGSGFAFGEVRLQVLHTPGHTPEHLTFLVTDSAAASEPMGAFTGDFLFVGDVGRPDLLERAARVRGAMEEGARQLFRSLQSFRDLPEYLQVWPGHGAGSACGKALGAVPQSTLGYEKRFNWAFGISAEAEFVRAVLAGQPEPPRYFAEMKRINRSGPPVLGERSRPVRLTPEMLAADLAAGGPIVDTRDAMEFGRRSIPGTINIPANRSFPTWAGSLLPYDRDFRLIAADHRVDELVRDLAGIGLDRMVGYWSPDVVDDFESRGKLQVIPRISLADVANGRKNDLIVDVRGEGEWNAGHIPNSLNLPLAELDQRLDEIPRSPLIVHCQSGSRAAIAASLLRARGFGEVQLFTGGLAEWRAAGLPTQSAKSG
jgi:hydroxyacylglutathione hydrolase